MSVETLERKIERYIEKYSLEEEGKEELVRLLNEALIEISRTILSEHKVVEKVEKVEKKNRMCKSKKAENYAEEHGLSLEDFEMKEVSKKDVENKVRDITKNHSLVKNKEENVKENVKENVISMQRVICSGINKKGEACKSIGTIRPNGAKKHYCFRHAEDYRSFECDSDSSDEEKEEEKEEENELKVEDYE
tara:strand:+ start:4506 stop:5081 length:576 start_codon:yes stop_codon:yes gene_type:complete